MQRGGLTMRSAVAVLLALTLAGASADSPVRHLRISGTGFVDGAGKHFDWRGISAFRLLEFVARGRAADAEAYLRWAASKRLNVVRVFAMADGIFQLAPEDGLKALPRLLELAATHGIYVEVVAFTGTEVIRVDRADFVKRIGAICARHGNAILELANEPGHPTQAAAMHDPAHLQSLVALVPKDVPVSLGSVEWHDGFAAGAFVTWHAPRTTNWHEEIGKGGELERRFGKPVVSDEPIGAADTIEPGRRDNDPARFRAAGAAARRAGIDSTFHYEGGLQARLPSAIEMRCLDAWLEGLDGLIGGR
jgi:hypothetical protein